MECMGKKLLFVFGPSAAQKKPTMCLSARPSLLCLRTGASKLLSRKYSEVERLLYSMFSWQQVHRY